MLEEIEKLKKIELHVHLDGSVSLDLASKLTNLPILKIKEQMVAKDKCLDLGEYLLMFDLPNSFMQTKENLKLIATDLVNRLEQENVIYAEIRFAPAAYYNSQNGEDNQANENEAECIVAKNRHGETSVVRLGWDGAHTRFSNLDVTHEF